MGHMGDGTEDGDLGRGRKRRGLKGSRPTGKARRRRLDEEDEQMEEVRIAKRRKRGISVTHVFCNNCKSSSLTQLQTQVADYWGDHIPAEPEVAQHCCS